MEKVNFAEKPDEARILINSRVSDLTNGTIKELLSQDSISALVRLVIVNAIYFKGTWKQ